MLTVHADIERMAAHALGLGADPREIEHFKLIAAGYLGPKPDEELPEPQGQLEYLGIAAMVKYYDAIVKAKDAEIAKLEAANDAQSKAVAALNERLERIHNLSA